MGGRERGQNEVGKIHRANHSGPCGHVKDLIFYSKCNRNFLKSFVQGRDAITFAVLKDHCGCCMANGLEESRAKSERHRDRNRFRDRDGDKR